MATLTSQLIVRLIDQVSGPASAASRALTRLIASSNQRGGTGISSLNQQLNAISTRAQELGNRASHAVATAAAPAAFGVAAAYRTALEFSKELNKATAIGELTEAQRRDVARTSREIGDSTQFSAAQAMAMQRALLAAGRTVEQAQGMARPIINAALFSDSDPFLVAKGITAISSAYRIQMRTVDEARREAERIGDLAAKASNLSQADFTDILQGFKYAAPFAHAAGWSMDQLAASVAHMANNGLRGDEAGTALRSMLVRMVKPTQDARQAMSELNLSFDDFFSGAKAFNLTNFSAGMANAGHRLNSRQQRRIADAVQRNSALPEDQQQDLAQVLTDSMIQALNIPQNRVQDRQKIARAVQRYAGSLNQGADPDALFKALTDAGVTPGQMARIFDARQGARLMTLLGPEYETLLKRLQAEYKGASERGAAQMERDLYGAHKRIQSAIEAMILSIAQSGVADRIVEIFNSISASLRSISQTDPGRLRAIGFGILALAAAAPVGLLLMGLAAVVKTMAAAFSLLAAASGPVGWAIIAIVAAFTALGVWAANNSAQITAFVQGFANAFNSRFPAAAAAVKAVSDGVSWLLTKIGELFGALGTSSSSLDTWASRGAIAASKVGDAIDAIAAIPGKISAAFGSLVSAASSKLDEIVAYLAALPGRMAAAIAAAGGALYEAGGRLIQSLIDGIKAKVNELMAYVQSIPGRISGAFSGIRVPGIGGGGGGAPVAGARASGGSVMRGSSYLVGERGPEIFTPGQSGRIAANGSWGGGGGGVQVTNTFNISGSDPEAIAREVQKGLAQAVRSASRDAYRDVGLSVG